MRKHLVTHSIFTVTRIFQSIPYPFTRYLRVLESEHNAKILRTCLSLLSSLDHQAVYTRIVLPLDALLLQCATTKIGSRMLPALPSLISHEAIFSLMGYTF